MFNIVRAQISVFKEKKYRIFISDYSIPIF
jgi:hypothetical protein